MDLKSILHLAITAFVSLVVLFLLTKFMGNKQMSELSMFDYITGITIGSIAAEMATELEEPWKPLVAMSLYAFISVLISYANYKSIRLRRLLTGRSLMLLNRDKIYKGNMRKGRIDVNEFLMLARNSGYFDISQLESAILEPNGKISFLPKADYRPVNPDDLKIKASNEGLVANIIIDGKIMQENLKMTGNNETWLMKQLHTYDVKDVSDVFLATCSINNEVMVYRKMNDLKQRDVLD